MARIAIARTVILDFCAAVLLRGRLLLHEWAPGVTWVTESVSKSERGPPDSNQMRSLGYTSN